MPGDEIWERCRDALRQLGSGVVWTDARRVAEVLAGGDGPGIPETVIRRALDTHATVLARGPDFPAFLSNGSSGYALLEPPADQPRPLAEVEVRNILSGCLSRLGPAVGADLHLLRTEYGVAGKYIDIAAEGPHKSLWVIEVKADTENGDGVGQAAGYVSLCRKHLPGYSSFFGVVVAPAFTDQAVAIAKDRNIRLARFRLCAEYSALPP